MENNSTLYCQDHLKPLLTKSRPSKLEGQSQRRERIKHHELQVVLGHIYHSVAINKDEFMEREKNTGDSCNFELTRSNSNKSSTLTKHRRVATMMQDSL